MNCERLPDLLKQWRFDNADVIAAATEQITRKVTRGWSNNVDPGDRVVVHELENAVADEVAAFAANELIPRGLQKLASEDVGPPEALHARVKADCAVDVRRLVPPTGLFLPPPVSRIPYSSLALASAVGALLGCLVLTPVSLLLLGQREPGLLVGGMVGAGVVVTLVAWLSQRPAVRRILQGVVIVAGLFAAVAVVFKTVWRQPRSLTRRAGLIAACWVILVLARPRLFRPTKEQCGDALRPQISHLLNHAADLVLAFLWTHPLRAEATKASAPRVELPTPVAEAVAVLHAVAESGDASGRHLKLAVDALLLSVCQEGYAWQIVRTGTPYDGAMDEHFKPFGTVEFGQPVETLEPAITRHGKVVKRGVLRSCVC